PLQTAEEIVLATLVKMQAADHAPPREGEVGLCRALRQQGIASQLHHPPALVLEASKRNQPDALDHLFTPVSSIRRPISAKWCQCLPASSHQPSSLRTSSRPSCAYERLMSVISSSPRLDG